MFILTQPCSGVLFLTIKSVNFFSLHFTCLNYKALKIRTPASPKGNVEKGNSHRWYLIYRYQEFSTSDVYEKYYKKKQNGNMLQWYI